MIIFVARDGKANLIVTILAIVAKSFVLSAVFTWDWAPWLITVRTVYELLGSILIFAIGAVSLNAVRRLEERLITRGEENEKLINKIPNGLLVITHDLQKTRGRVASSTETLVLSNSHAESIIKEGRPTQVA